jgi:hypothetical protein
MIDLETLGTKDSAVILTIGAIKFNPYSLNEPSPGFYLKLDVDEQVTMGRSIDDATLAWWGQQSESIRDDAFSEGDREAIQPGIDRFHKFVWGSDVYWAHGPVFDMIILENLYRSLNKSYPWQYHQIRDSRTLFSLGVDPEMHKDDGAHNALVDAYWQAKGVQTVFKKLGITE